MEMIGVTIDGQKVEAAKNSTVLQVAQAIGINIPTLCYHPELRTEGKCRVCMVEVAGVRTLVAACVYPVHDGMVIRTTTAAVREARKLVVELLLANHPQDCLSCQRNLNCELQNIASDLGIRKVRFEGERKNYPIDTGNPAIVHDQSKCILCGRCVRVCSDRQGMHVYSLPIVGLRRR